jgi:hypothetical protein
MAGLKIRIGRRAMEEMRKAGSKVAGFGSSNHDE